MKRKRNKVAAKDSVPSPGETEEALESDAFSQDPYLDELDSSIDLIQEEPTRFDVPAPEAEAVPEPKKKPTVSAPSPPPEPATTADLAADIPVELHVVVGEKKMSLAEILALEKGSIIELGKGLDPVVDLMVQDKVVARGELVEVDGHLGVRLLRVLEGSS